MTLHVNIAQAKAKLSELVARAEAGEEVILARAGKPAVRLTPVPAVGPAHRRIGAWEQLVPAEDSAPTSRSPFGMAERDAAFQAAPKRAAPGPEAAVRRVPGAFRHLGPLEDPDLFLRPDPELEAAARAEDEDHLYR